MRRIRPTATRFVRRSIREGIAKASATISDVAGAWIKDQSLDVANGKVVGYRVTMKLTFVLHKAKSKK